MPSTEKRQIAWEVWRGSLHIDTVYFDPGCDAAYVLESLINHDGYPADIEVRRED